MKPPVCKSVIETTTRARKIILLAITYSISDIMRIYPMVAGIAYKVAKDKRFKDCRIPLQRLLTQKYVTRPAVQKGLPV